MKKNLVTILSIITAVCFLATLGLLFTGTAPAVYTLPLVLVGIVCAFAGLWFSEHDDTGAQLREKHA